MKYKNILILILINYFIITVNTASARWVESEDDIAVKYDYYREELSVNADGTFESLVEYQATILKEQGRNQFAKLYLHYNEDSDKLNILEAVTINKDQVYNLSKDMIEDKPLASASDGFDQQRQVLLSFPNVEVKSKIKLKFRYKNFQPVLDKEFSIVFPYHNYYENINIKINSKLPLNLKFNDPYQRLKINTDKSQGLYNLEITNTKPIHNLVLEEPTNGVVNSEQATWVSLSSLDNWEDLGKKFAPGYYQVINQPLPKIFKDIRTAAALVRGDINRINTVTSLLNEKIQYMGDWRSVKGRLFPRPLATIANSQVADCKDFSVSTAAILKQLGYKAQVALVMRGITNRSAMNLPGVNNFNHAMLKVTNKAGEVYWIDPTNTVSMAQGIFPDISGKKVLILDLEKSTYEQIPDISQENSKILHNTFLEINGNNVSHNGNIWLKGENALSFTGEGLYLAKKNIENGLFYMLAGSYIEEDPDKKILLPDLTSRIVKDLDIKYQFKKNNHLINTNLGFGMKLMTPSIVETIISSNINQVSDLLIGPPNTKIRNLIIKDRNITKPENLNYQIDTPWIYFSRECSNVEKNIEIKDTVIVKMMFIPNKDLKSDLYQQFKNNLESMIKDALLVLS